MTSQPEFNQETGATEVTAAFKDQIKGKNVVVTGVSPNSIGESTAIALAAQEPTVLILASRTRSKLDEVETTVKSQYPNVKVKTVLLDLMSQASVKTAAEQIKEMIDELHILINNAGVMLQTRQTSKEGYEGQFAANHLGHFLLTNLLMSRLKAAAVNSPPGSVRIVNVSSQGHRLSPIRFHDYNLEGKEIPDEEKCPFPLAGAFGSAIDGYYGFLAYGQSKTANILFSVSLTERLKDVGIVSYALHPGGVWTGLSRDLNAEGVEAIGQTSNFWKTFDQGASTTCVAALDPALNNPKAVFLDNCQFASAADHALNSATAEKLWHLSENLVGQDFTVT